ncbi:uncharacterized protein BO66DRAFT_152687 [Aspergillus aculeatinus CBS 121060]|uniref:Uncharacterized protein n=1 Tax=Aspergillus aculeatinus CBS 121060 TaxID=1448322 RepID=A0ACD1H1P6_9EURO|nr:hypothetical protein BO66DRAFT_152687 [Aspergillus aculeatinus CBS 121060]RAH67507.1 hypothetical protein BO66DRAFT_152687 [Aspergillus aculeatinus CBS 121060]
MSDGVSTPSTYLPSNSHWCTCEDGLGGGHHALMLILVRLVMLTLLGVKIDQFRCGMTPILPLRSALSCGIYQRAMFTRDSCREIAGWCA